MTEADKIAHARVYMEKLANGINPLTNQVVPDADLINNVRISRCFFYVVQLLKDLEEQANPVRETGKSAKSPFRLSLEARAKFAFSDVPIPMTYLVRRINDLIDVGQMTRIRRRQILEWLIEKGALAVKPRTDGKTVHSVTPVGRELGISTVLRETPYATYAVILYNRDAQQFILDNLDAIIGHSTKSNGRGWAAPMPDGP